MTEVDLIKKLDELRALPAETEVVEFKEAKNDYDFKKLGKYFSALSNEANLKQVQDAWLVFGIENTLKNIVGSNYRSGNRSELDSLKGEIANKTTNRITFIEIYELNLPEVRVVMFQIPAAPRGIPIAWEGYYHGRDGEELSPLNIEEIERIRKQATYTDWSAGICDIASINDLDNIAITVARKNYVIKNPKLEAEINSWDDITFLNKARITINGQITRTSILLLGKPESQHFINPAVASISWILKDKDNIEKDYQHFTCPFILAVDQIFAKIRNLKYRYVKSSSLFPEEVDQYEQLNIKEALSNCIAHQDYPLGGRINLIEKEDGYLIFSNLGEFLPGTIENVIEKDSPPDFNRNNFLVQAMFNLNMMDSIGSGIKRMFRLQRERFFPMPDYDFTEGKVKATLIGKQLDMEYAKVLAQNRDLTLSEIIMLDKVQKKKLLTDIEISHLKSKGLIEGRKPNYHISQIIAASTDQKSDYIKNRGLKDQHYKDLILEFINKYGEASKEEIYKLILDILPKVLDDVKKNNKVRNIVYAMSKKDKSIENKGTSRNPIWKRMI